MDVYINIEILDKATAELFRKIHRRPHSHSSGLTYTPLSKRRTTDNLQHHSIGYLPEALDDDT